MLNLIFLFNFIFENPLLVHNLTVPCDRGESTQLRKLARDFIWRNIGLGLSGQKNYLTVRSSDVRSPGETLSKRNLTKLPGLPSIDELTIPTFPCNTGVQVTGTSGLLNLDACSSYMRLVSLRSRVLYVTLDS